ncbi:uncharacterized protein O3Q21_011190 isoform 2-T2 [Podargus strigoides]
MEKARAQARPRGAAEAGAGVSQSPSMDSPGGDLQTSPPTGPSPGPECCIQGQPQSQGHCGSCCCPMSSQMWGRVPHARDAQRHRAEEEAQKMQFLETIRTLCEAARHKGLSQDLNAFCHRFELADNIKVLLEEEPRDRLCTVVQQLAMEASLETLDAMDIMLQMLVFRSPASGSMELQTILQALMLLTFTSSPSAAVCERAVGRIGRLSDLLASSSSVKFPLCQEPSRPPALCRTGLPKEHGRSPSLAALLPLLPSQLLWEGPPKL